MIKWLENKEEKQRNQNQLKKICAGVKCLYLHKGLFLARHWTVCSSFYLNKENGIFEVEEI